MALPRYSDVDLALLLELTRLGRPVRPHETYDHVTRHFPHLTDEDTTAVRRDGRTRVWTNMIHWARDHLRVQNVLNEDRGVWSVNSAARPLLERWLTARGGANVTAFITSNATLAEYLGANWARSLRARSPNQPRRPSAIPIAVESSAQAARPDSEPTLAGILTGQENTLREELLGRLRGMDDQEFENFVARILDALGFRDTTVVGRPGDGGVDVKCVLRNVLVEATVAVQVKRQVSNVGPKEISYLRDRWARRVDKLLFVTTSDYTAGAREVAEEDGLKPVVVVNGTELADLMIRERIGVLSEAVQRLHLDEDFFSV